MEPAAVGIVSNVWRIQQHTRVVFPESPGEEKLRKVQDVMRAWLRSEGIAGEITFSSGSGSFVLEASYFIEVLKGIPPHFLGAAVGGALFAAAAAFWARVRSTANGGGASGLLPPGGQPSEAARGVDKDAFPTTEYFLIPSGSDPGESKARFLVQIEGAAGQRTVMGQVTFLPDGSQSLQAVSDDGTQVGASGSPESINKVFRALLP